MYRNARNNKSELHMCCFAIPDVRAHVQKRERGWGEKGRGNKMACTEMHVIIKVSCTCVALQSQMSGHMFKKERGRESREESLVVT